MRMLINKISFYETKAKKYKMELEKIRKLIKETEYKVNKFCDYILTRPSLPESITKVDNENTKMKQSIEAIAYMARHMQKKEKEISEVLREKDQLQYTLEAVKRERDYLKRNIDVMAKVDYDKKRKKEVVS